jgi:hypothetical protein
MTTVSGGLSTAASGIVSDLGTTQTAASNLN